MLTKPAVMLAFASFSWGCGGSDTHQPPGDAPAMQLDGPTHDSGMADSQGSCSLLGQPCFMAGPQPNNNGCCAGFVCPFGDVVAAGVHGCQPCGEVGQYCCGNNDTCHAGARCLGGSNGNSNCFACGGLNQPCCGGDACQSGLTCTPGGTFGNECVPSPPDAGGSSSAS
jgi:hypothetical protein